MVPSKIVQIFDDQFGVLDFILSIQNNEFGLGFNEADLIDLRNINSVYKLGGFWIATLENELIGCIALERLNPSIGILRRFFVKKEYRGSKYNVAMDLYKTLLQKSIDLSLKKIVLDTPSVATASHRFYRKVGFQRFDINNKPTDFKYTDKQSILFVIELN
jgi:N-acetylglutamate synthase-like GNAT family acetyltransferase